MVQVECAQLGGSESVSLLTFLHASSGGLRAATASLNTVVHSACDKLCHRLSSSSHPQAAASADSTSNNSGMATAGEFYYYTAPKVEEPSPYDPDELPVDPALQRLLLLPDSDADSSEAHDVPSNLNNFRNASQAASQAWRGWGFGVSNAIGSAPSQSDLSNNGWAVHGVCAAAVRKESQAAARRLGSIIEERHSHREDSANEFLAAPAGDPGADLASHREMSHWSWSSRSSSAGSQLQEAVTMMEVDSLVSGSTMQTPSTPCPSSPPSYAYRNLTEASAPSVSAAAASLNVPVPRTASIIAPESAPLSPQGAPLKVLSLASGPPLSKAALAAIFNGEKSQTSNASNAPPSAFPSQPPKVLVLACGPPLSPAAARSLTTSNNAQPQVPAPQTPPKQEAPRNLPSSPPSTAGGRMEASHRPVPQASSPPMGNLSAHPAGMSQSLCSTSSRKADAKEKGAEKQRVERECEPRVRVPLQRQNSGNGRRRNFRSRARQTLSSAIGSLRGSTSSLNLLQRFRDRQAAHKAARLPLSEEHKEALRLSILNTSMSSFTKQLTLRRLSSISSQ